MIGKDLCITAMSNLRFAPNSQLLWRADDELFGPLPSQLSVAADTMAKIKKGGHKGRIAKRRTEVRESWHVRAAGTVSTNEDKSMVTRRRIVLEGGDSLEKMRKIVELQVAKEEEGRDVFGGESSRHERNWVDLIYGKNRKISSTKNGTFAKAGGEPDVVKIRYTSQNGMPDFFGANSGPLRRQLPTVVPPISIRHLLERAFSGSQSLAGVVCDAADSFITSVLTPLSHRRHQKSTAAAAALLQGLAAPVAESPPTNCRLVHGQIPPDLSGGVYLRNGPNATSVHQGDDYHVFDGDGMLHAVKLPSAADGIPVYCSRFVQTSRFQQEKNAGRPLMVKFFGGMVGVAGVARLAVTILRSVLGILDIRNGCGLSNTSVCYFNGRILSLSEDDLPYEIRVSDDGDLLTVGRFTLPSKANMCSHPKFDPITGDMYAFSINLPLPMPPFSVFRLSADGTQSVDNVPVPLFDLPIVHDFAITDRFVVFPDGQLVIRPWEMVKGKTPIFADAGKTPRLCLMTRDAVPEESPPAPAIWFDVPGVNCLHYINAWDEGEDEVVIVAAVLSPLDRFLQLNVSSTPTKIRLKTKTGEFVSSQPICAAGRDDLEFGVINPNYTGKKTRYAYLTTGAFPRLSGVVKVDLSQPPESAIVASRDFASEGYYGGEPCFVPARGSASEDDGYLLCLVGDEGKDVSHLLIMDAQSPSLRVMASVELPSRVPPGFHGCFVTAEQLKQHRDLS